MTEHVIVRYQRVQCTALDYRSFGLLVQTKRWFISSVLGEEIQECLHDSDEKCNVIKLLEIFLIFDRGHKLEMFFDHLTIYGKLHDYQMSSD